MSTKAQAYLPEESATELAEAIEREETQVVFSYAGVPYGNADDGTLKYLDEITQGDLIIDPQKILSPRQMKHISRVMRFKKATELLNCGIAAALFMLAGFSVVLFGLFTRQGLTTPAVIAGISVVPLSLSAALSASSYNLWQRYFPKFTGKYGLLQFPEVDMQALRKANLNHEQVYEIARLGIAKINFHNELEEIVRKLTANENLMRSDRVLREETRLREQLARIERRINRVNESIAEIIATNERS